MADDFMLNSGRGYIADDNQFSEQQKRYEVGKRLRLLRKELNLSQTEMGEIMDMHPSVISLIETGRRTLRRDRHTELLEMYPKRSISIEWLMEGTGEPFISLEDQLLRINFGDDEFIRDFILIYLALDDSKKQAIREIVRQMHIRKTDRKSDATGD